MLVETNRVILASVSLVFVYVVNLQSHQTYPPCSRDELIKSSP